MSSFSVWQQCESNIFVVNIFSHGIVYLLENRTYEYHLQYAFMAYRTQQNSSFLNDLYLMFCGISSNTIDMYMNFIKIN